MKTYEVATNYLNSFWVLDTQLRLEYLEIATRKDVRVGLVGLWAYLTLQTKIPKLLNG